MRTTKMLTPILIIISAVALRLLPHPPNVAPVAAMALFGGAYLDKRYAIILPLAAMLVSDVFLGFHDTMLFVYSSFVLTCVIGMSLRKRRKLHLVIGASLLSSILFFLITNFGVWLMGALYPKTLAGLLQSYLMGLPFFRNTVIGDLLYTGLFFGGYEAVRIVLKGYEQKFEARNPKS